MKHNPKIGVGNNRFTYGYFLHRGNRGLTSGLGRPAIGLVLLMNRDSVCFLIILFSSLWMIYVVPERSQGKNHRIKWKKGRNHLQEENKVTPKLKEFLFSTAIKSAISQECVDVSSTNFFPTPPNVMGRCDVTGRVKQCTTAYFFPNFLLVLHPISYGFSSKALCSNYSIIVFRRSRQLILQYL